jgi:flagellin
MSILNINTQTLLDARNLGRINERLGASLDQLSSGTIDISSDPAAIGSVNKLEALNKRAQAAATNVQNAASFVQSSDSLMASMGGVLSRMSELTQDAKDSTKSSSDISLYQSEFKVLQDQLRQTIGGTTAEIGGTSDITHPLGTFNGVVLFGPNASGISVASGSSAGQSIVIPQTNLRSGAILDLFKQDASGNYTLSVTDAAATQKITDAIGNIADGRSILGGVSSRLDLASHTLSVESQNITAAVSSIQDVNVATESTRLTKLNLLLSSGTAMLSQANQSPQSVLQLLKS